MRLKLFFTASILIAIGLLLSCRQKWQQQSTPDLHAARPGPSERLYRALQATISKCRRAVSRHGFASGSRTRTCRTKPATGGSVVGASHTTFQTAADENLLLEFRPSWADKVPASSRDANDRWYGTYETPQVIAYNSDAVPAGEAPRDWDDVLDPKWRDKVSFAIQIHPTPCARSSAR